MVCKKLSRLGDVHGGKAPYVVCAHCETQNKVVRLRTFLDGAPEYAVIGIRLKDDQ
ncbi:MAG TPA: hypothetical protein VFB01_16470 [Burkholderiales bacterium]|nr:hypothetical protein [Burkholderiales bacterium]